MSRWLIQRIKAMLLCIVQWQIYIVKFWMHAPLGVQILSISYSFWEILANHMLALPQGVGVPTSGKSWICHCCVCYVFCRHCRHEDQSMQCIECYVCRHCQYWCTLSNLICVSFHLYQQCQHCQYILAHNFLNIQPIFNPFEVLESSESGLFNCINSVNIVSTFRVITSLIFNQFSSCLKF